MVPTTAVLRPEAVIKVSWHELVVVAVPIQVRSRVIVKAIVAADGAPIAIDVVSIVATWSPGSVVAVIVATWSTGVIRRIRLADLNTQASRSKRKCLCFRRGSVCKREQTDGEYCCCDPLDELGHGGPQLMTWGGLAD